MSGEGSDGGEGAFAAALGPHLDELSAAARARADAQEAEEQALARAATVRHLDEEQLMALIFAHLDPDNPRVCEGIDFERIVICEAPTPDVSAPSSELEPVEPRAPATTQSTSSELAPVESRAAASPPPELDEHAGTQAPDPPPDPPAQPAPAVAPATARAWVGASWSDDLGPIIELVERPELSAVQLELLRQVPRTSLPELNLRYLDRHAALRHLELFVDLCRARGDRWCRVITGKGIESAGEPVLKRVVLEWCVARPPRPSGVEKVRAWAPELDSYGEWGALIVRLRVQ